MAATPPASPCRPNLPKRVINDVEEQKKNGRKKKIYIPQQSQQNKGDIFWLPYLPPNHFPPDFPWSLCHHFITVQKVVAGLFLLF